MMIIIFKEEQLYLAALNEPLEDYFKCGGRGTGWKFLLFLCCNISRKELPQKVTFLLFI